MPTRDRLQIQDAITPPGLQPRSSPRDAFVRPIGRGPGRTRQIDFAPLLRGFGQLGDAVQAVESQRANAQAQSFLLDNPDAASEIEKAYAERVKGVTDPSQRREVLSETFQQLIDRRLLPEASSPLFLRSLSISVARDQAQRYGEELRNGISQFSEVLDPETGQALPPPELDTFIAETRARYAQGFSVAGSLYGAEAFAALTDPTENQFRDLVHQARLENHTRAGRRFAARDLIEGAQGEEVGFEGLESLMRAKDFGPERLAPLEEFIDLELRQNRNVGFVSELLGDALSTLVGEEIVNATSPDDLAQARALLVRIGDVKINGLAFAEDASEGGGRQMLSELKASLRREEDRLQDRELRDRRAIRADVVEVSSGLIDLAINDALENGENPHRAVDEVLGRIQSDPEIRDLTGGESIGRSLFGEVQELARRRLLNRDTEGLPLPLDVAEELSLRIYRGEPFREVIKTLDDLVDSRAVSPQAALAWKLENGKQERTDRFLGSSPDFNRLVAEPLAQLRVPGSFAPELDASVLDSVSQAEGEIRAFIRSKTEGITEEATLATAVREALNDPFVKTRIESTRSTVTEARQRAATAEQEINTLTSRSQFDEARAAIEGARGVLSSESQTTLLQRLEEARRVEATEVTSPQIREALARTLASAEIVFGNDEFFQNEDAVVAARLQVEGAFREKAFEIIRDTRNLDPATKAAERDSRLFQARLDAIKEILPAGALEILNQDLPEAKAKARVSEHEGSRVEFINGAPAVSLLPFSGSQIDGVTDSDRAIFDELRAGDRRRLFQSQEGARIEAERDASLAVLRSSELSRSDAFLAVFGTWKIPAEDILAGSTTVTARELEADDFAALGVPENLLNRTQFRVGRFPTAKIPRETRAEIRRILEDRGYEVTIEEYQSQVEGTPFLGYRYSISSSVDLRQEGQYQHQPMFTQHFETPAELDALLANEEKTRQLFAALTLPTDGDAFDSARTKYREAQLSLIRLNN